MANTTVFYKSHKDGFVNVDEMSEVHLKNVLKKLIRDGLVPEGKVEVDQVDPALAAKALQSLNEVKTSIATMGTPASKEGEQVWEQVIENFSKVQVLLNQYIPAPEQPKKNKAA